MAGEAVSNVSQKLVAGKRRQLLTCENGQDAFRLHLDETLILAIAGDHNLQDKSGYEAAREILEDLARNAPSDEAAGFTPVGIPGLVDGGSDGARDDSTASTGISHAASRTHSTDPSSEDASSCTAGEGLGTTPRLTSFDNDSPESKLVLLASMFAELSDLDVRFAFRRAKGDFQASLDELLNVQYLKSTGQQVKGIDGFFTEDAQPAKSKRSKKRKGNGSAASSSQGCSLGRNKGHDKIQFIADRFGIRADEVSDVFSKNKRDDMGRKRADELAKRYPHVPVQYMPTIVHVAGPIPQFADELAEVLDRHLARSSKGQRLDLDYRLTPLPPEAIESDGRTGTSECAWTDCSQARPTTHECGQGRRDALAIRPQLPGRGAFDALHKQAASVCSTQAQDATRQASSTAADKLVLQQSSADAIDLHGVAVLDGVRIALQKTRNWWDGLGECRARKAKQNGFTVITGLGRHNPRGVSKLRKAVAAALLQDGWKVQLETGKFLVTGRR